jgi:hypothetical protein
MFRYRQCTDDMMFDAIMAAIAKVLKSLKKDEISTSLS